LEHLINHLLKFLFILFFISIFFASCKSTNDVVVEEIVELIVKPVAFQIKNGETVNDFVNRLVDMELVTYRGFQKVAEIVDYSEYDFVPESKEDINRFEGVFIPGTYDVSSDKLRFTGHLDFEESFNNALVIVNTLLDKSKERFDKIAEVNGLSKYDIITLASIVEKEAASDLDYDKVADVFHKRLKYKWRLGSCPTVEYALGYHRPFLTFKDIEIESPYNVYKNIGLPPTPISFFSSGALDAVVNPIKTPYYFFVFDWTTGKLHFSVTFDEHKSRVAEARQNFVSIFPRSLLHKKFDDVFYENNLLDDHTGELRAATDFEKTETF